MISLRAYNREIEELIDNGQYDESIAHCQHILSLFPKCIETYRNLGKALLELKKYPEAMDIFSRVLSAFPDDFISHIGLSIIYEDQKKLDLSIWHMEQAFDVQPSNLAIQDELKRLFTLRDGEHSGKIRLTRGALVRMYARGELFQQAISEVKTILAQDPKRVDLEVLLAKMIFSSGAIAEAEDVCNHIIESNPFCFEVNQILQQIYLTHDSIDSASICRDRLIALDPYYRFKESPLIDQDISDDKISLEKLDYSSDQNMTGQVFSFENSITSQWNEKNTEGLDWLKSIDNQKNISPNSDSITDTGPDQDIINESDAPSLINQMPAWMKEAGWTIVNDSNESDRQGNIPLYVDQDKDHMLESESLDVKKQLEINNSSVQNSSEKKQNTSLRLETTPQSHVTSNDLSVLFSELREGKMNDENLNNVENGETIPNSDWKSQFSSSDMEDAKDSHSEEMPDWLKNIEEEIKIDKNDSDDMPEWLLNLQSSVEPVDENQDELRIASMRDELQGESDNSPVIEDQTVKMESDAETESQEINKSDGWEKIDLTSEENKEINSVIQEKNEVQKNTISASEESIPDWVKSVLSPEISTTYPESDASTQGKISYVEEPSVEAVLPKTADIKENDLDQSDAGIISQQTNDELLDWLRGLKNNEENNPSTESSSIPLDSTDLVTNESLDANALDRLQIFSENLIEPENKISLDNDSSQKTDSNNLSENRSTDSIEVEIDQNVLSEEESVTAISDSDEEVDLADTSEIPEPILESTIENFGIETPDTHFESLEVMLNKKAYDQIPEIFKKMETDGMEFDSIIQMVDKLASDHIEDFSFWQTLGDQCAQHGKFAKALTAYQKAEELLIKSIS